MEGFSVRKVKGGWIFEIDSEEESAEEVFTTSEELVARVCEFVAETDINSSRTAINERKAFLKEVSAGGAEPSG